MKLSWKQAVVIGVTASVFATGAFAQTNEFDYGAGVLKGYIAGQELKQRQQELDQLHAEAQAELELQRQRLAALQHQQSVQRQPKPVANVIESYIDGDFEGWDGDTIFKLDNGQIWQQSSYSYAYHYAYHPEVLIYRGESGLYKMRVEDMGESIYVKRLR